MLGEETMQNVALVTGASKGIGLELAREHALRGGDLVLVARSQDRLEEIRDQFEAEYKVSVRVLPEDLTDPSSPPRIWAALQAEGVEVATLINNAGFGGHGKFHQRPLEEELSMVELNISALTALTHLFLSPMVARGKGRVLNVASTAGFLPGPLQAVYYATKAYVLSFSQAISEELRGTGVSVTALCPGPVRTEFVERAELEGVNAFMRSNSAENVAKVGYRGMEKQKRVVIDDWLLSLSLNWIVPFLPRGLLLRVSRYSMEK